MASLHGTVADRSGRPVSGARVAALTWSKQSTTATVLAETATDTAGHYAFDLTPPPGLTFFVIAVLAADGTPDAWSPMLQTPPTADVHLVVGNVTPDLEPSRPLPLANPTPAMVAPAPIAAEPAAAAPAEPGGRVYGRVAVEAAEASYRVAGRVAFSDGSPVQGIMVRAVDRDLRREEPLGPISNVTTDADGHYRIVYGPAQFTRTEKAGADLVVRVVDASGTVIVSSPTWFNAPRDAEVDLTVPMGAASLPAEYERLVAAIASLLDTPPPAGLMTLVPSDRMFLVNETGSGMPQVETLISAVALLSAVAPTAATAPPADGSVLEAVFGLIRLGDRPDWPTLARLGAPKLAADIRSAVEAGYIGPPLAASADTLAAHIIAAAGTHHAAMVAASAPLAEPTVRYALVEQVTSAAVDASLDAALAAAVRKAVGRTGDALRVALDAALTGLHWRSVLAPTGGGAPMVTIGDVGAAALRRAVIIDAAATGDAADATPRLGSTGRQTIRDALSLDTPVATHPLLRDHIRIGTASGLAGIAGLDPAATTTLTITASPLFDAPETVLGNLVARAALTAMQASQIAAALDLGRLTNDHLPIMRQLAPQVGTSISSLAAWSAEQWRSVIGAAALPPGETAETYIAHLMASLEFSFPAHALAARMPGSTGAPVSAFLAANPDVDLRAVSLNSTDTGALNWQGVGDQAAVVPQLRTYQRLMALADTTDDRVSLATTGFTSAMTITARPQAEFVASAGMPEPAAIATYARAQELALAVSQAYGAFHDVMNGAFKRLPVANISSTYVDDLLKIDGLSDLFGSQDYCACSDCASILSPAAYFVDLMHFAEQQVSTPTFITPKLTTHPLYLKNRRPDLWTLKLTCDNTNTLVPYLQIVVEVLEAYLIAALNQPDLYGIIAGPGNTASCSVPFSLPYAELGLYLGYFGLSPADVYTLLQHPATEIAVARSGLSAVEAAIIATPGPATIPQRLGLADAAGLVKMPVVNLIGRLGISRADLTTLLASRYAPDLALVTVIQNPAPDQVQTMPEILENLTAARADVLHRLVRLQRPLPWTLADLDLVLLTLREAGLIGADIDDAAIAVIGRLRGIQTAWRLTVAQLTAVAGALPVSTSFPRPAPRARDRLLYEQAFDLAGIFGLDQTGKIKNSRTLYLYAFANGSPGPGTQQPTPLLLAGLGITDTELVSLFALLAQQIPFDKGTCLLDRNALSLLYRHVLVARSLSLNVSELVATLRLRFAPGVQALTSLDQIEALVDFGHWLASAPLTVAQLDLVINGVDSAGAPYRHNPATAAAMVMAVQAADASATTPPDAVATLTLKLSAAFSAGAQRLTDLLAWTGQDIHAPAINTALAATFTNGAPDQPTDIQPLLDLLHRLERANLLFTQLRIGDTALDYITAKSAVLGIADLTTLRLDDISALTLFSGFTQRIIAPSVAAVDAPGSGLDAVAITSTLLDTFSAHGMFTDGDQADLGRLLGADTGLIGSIVKAFAPPPPAVPIAALGRVAEVLAMCRTLGVDGSSLLTIGADPAGAGAVVAGAIAASFPDQASRDTAMEPYDDRIRTIKRDVLCGYITDAFPQLKFTSHDDLYDFFLLDVDMSGCARTSRVVSKTNSVQLYIQRCQTGLEQTAPAAVGVAQIHVDPATIPPTWWAWMKNFRVWQANRKVFLYPEAYLDPDLRDDKSPIFDDVIDVLLQRDITNDTAEEAFASYLSDLSELAHLRIVGTYFDEAKATYHFFGRTQKDPAQFYHRTWGASVWGAWEKIDLPIDGPYLSAITYRGRLHIFWVDTKTKDHTTISGGTSTTDYYTVHASLVYSVRRADGSWHSPQVVDWLIPDPDAGRTLNNQVYGREDVTYLNGMTLVRDVTPENVVREMSLLKSYRKTYPRILDGSIIHTYNNSALDYPFHRRLDTFLNTLSFGPDVPVPPTAKVVGLYINGSTMHAQLGVYEVPDLTEDYYDLQLEQAPSSATMITGTFPYAPPEDPTDSDQIFTAHVVHNRAPEFVIKIDDQQFLVQDLSPTASPKAPLRRLVRLSTSVADKLGEREATDGLDGLLGLDMQTSAVEPPLQPAITSPVELAEPTDETDHIDLTNAFGQYYQELYLHLPWIIAHQLNAAGRYEDAMVWYRRIFDPTATGSKADTSPAERNWRYVGFRDQTGQSLQQALTDPKAIQAYQTDPFNPFAIARLRPVAFQKAIVMQFIDNLLDWGDQLFGQDTMESINEATMLYMLAAEILGPRPIAVGDCRTSDDDLTYDVIGPKITTGSDVLITVENWVYRTRSQVTASASAQSASPPKAMAVQDPGASDATMVLPARAHSAIPVTIKLPAYGAMTDVVEQRSKSITNQATKPNYYPPQLISQAVLAFCIPPDDVLMSYWDRVSDRLYKIRNCMNISGMRRQLALFAPPIDPMDLIRARAAGMSLEDAILGLDDDVPPYRYSALIERARQAAHTVSGFGSALLSALQCKDGEELQLLRSVHEQTILQMTHAVKQGQVEEAQDQAGAAGSAVAHAQARVDYYQGLLDSGLNAWEQTEAVTRASAMVMRSLEIPAHLSAALTYLVPQLGSPFAMKYGGQELGHSMAEFSQTNQASSSFLDAVATSASMEATFQRRRQDWSQQLLRALLEVQQSEQQQAAANIRVAYVQQELDIHETSVDQAAELDALYRKKFTNLGLYTYLAQTLTRIHRQGYQAAFQLAKAAQSAYRYEQDDSTVYIAPDNWDSGMSGLLSGDRLLMQLQQMDNAYITKNTRRFEVTQAFALSLVSPAALVALRVTGSATFDIPEILFDLVYPGHYKRLIKSVRITLPGVIGPYTSVGANLSFTNSMVRNDPSVGPDGMTAGPKAPDIPTVIATSTGVNDSGLFQLDYRDERYLPFEGSGAVGTWQIALPGKVRSFDYQTIADAVVHISYTALDGGETYRIKIEDEIAEALSKYPGGTATGFVRLFSLRHDFPVAYYQLLDGTSPVSTSIEITPQHFSYFLSQRTLATADVTLALLPVDGSDNPVDTAGLAMTVNGLATGAWSVSATLGVSSATIPVTGTPHQSWLVTVAAGSLDPAKVGDLLFLLRYQVSK